MSLNVKQTNVSYVKQTNISYGIIAFYIDDETKEISYHLVQRRDTISYIKFIRGKVLYKDLFSAFCLMTKEEKERLFLYDFKDIWNDMYNYNYAYKRTDFNSAFEKFEMLKKSGELNKFHELTLNKNHSLEWGIPKGRKKKITEPNIICALREYKEETKSKSYLDFINIDPFTDILEISPIEIYKSIFYVAQSKYQPLAQQVIYNTGKIIRPFISEETNDVKWVSLEKSKELVPNRIYNILNILDNIIKQQFKIVSLNYFI